MKYQECSSHGAMPQSGVSVRLEEEFYVHYQLCVLVITFGFKKYVHDTVQVKE